MFTLLTELTPLWEVVRSLMKDVDLSIGAVRAHDFLFDWLSDGDLFDQIIQNSELFFPFLRRDDLDDAGLHAVGINLLHL